MDTKMLDARIEKMIENRKFLAAAPEGEDVKVRVNYCAKLIFEIGVSTGESFKKDLKKSREYARVVIPEWTDKMRQVWSSSSLMYISYECLSHNAAIWMVVPADDFPPELLGDTCRIKKTERVSDEYAMVCNG